MFPNKINDKGMRQKEQSLLDASGDYPNIFMLTAPHINITLTLLDLKLVILFYGVQNPDII